jgi:hypothetical protein
MTQAILWQKSSFSEGGDGNTCVEVGWQKSSFSDGGDGNTCVELSATPTTLHLRESDTPTTILTTTRTPLTHLLQAIRHGALNATPQATPRG